ncbi:NAD(P)-binding protein [Roseovarius gahaiensis]|uniref:NAD(P)-binding protein n=1 Tax=Roseovarius gahaiensis TaxID=2716691 RepID=A0A967BBH2_9RHOB|nr:FAD-dependent monooxygenase [Roseovarius gahaiensis]NHQ73026.1 NAD(P)-binding protein [Roseovarius gahaiensis]
MSLHGLKTLVIGGGIGGLTAARAMALRGADVTVLEQAAEISEVGAGLQISPNGFVVLNALGLGQALRECSVQARAVNLHDYRGPKVVSLDLGRLDSRDYYFVHRADLVDVLAQGAREAGVKIRLLQNVQSVTLTPGQTNARVTLCNGAVLSADLVVGADGLHSVVRPALNGQVAPFFTGQVAWRAIVPNADNAPPEARVHMGPHRHLVSYPLRDGQYMNLVAVQERAAWAKESWSQQDDPLAVQAAFADFGPDVQRMLSRIESVNLWGLFRHPVANRWYGGGAALLGDAAHPTLPFMAQGACMALEDAWALADCLDRAGDLESGLSTYQQRRKPRATRVVDAANGNAWKYHLAFSPLRWAAHTALRIGGTVAPDRLLRQFDWIYGYDVTRPSG